MAFSPGGGTNEADGGSERCAHVEIPGRFEKGRLSELEAAELLGVTERTFRRWRRRYGEEGEGGLVDRRLGKPSPKRVPEAEAERIGQLYRVHGQALPRACRG